MTQSKPKTLRIASMVLYLILVAALICLLTIEWLTDLVWMNALSEAFLTVLATLAGFFFIVAELPIVLAVTIDDEKIIVKNLLTRSSKKFWIDCLHSFKVSTEIQIFGELQVDLILMRHGEEVESISLQYVVNVDQIIKQLEKHLQNVTEDEYGFLQMIRGQRNN